ncbi:monovalent cation/H(+) antiporter subunit G [Aminobacter aganoensis]|uniref:Multicomponent K+:H+ antiporter subunit G n=1 Tax=Aminobacter aganoensis TaxID=83264 RepID=A0A7X0F4S6_9HYPH|nr:monovalent cation/H(+) antiporter subunit G [Aminobacter aganoensis]MBB6353079.1 multicomponent K+:H+ antiporter subunit G [Aminobacter aganoensis]
MSHAENLPAWAALLVAFLVLAGAGLTLIGAIGTLRFRSFFERVHAPTLGTSWGTGAIVVASMILFSVLGSRPVLHEVLIGVFISVTTPVTLMLLARAALYRDRSEGSSDVPPDHLADKPDER